MSIANNSLEQIKLKIAEKFNLIPQFVQMECDLKKELKLAQDELKRVQDELRSVKNELQSRRESVSMLMDEYIEWNSKELSQREGKENV